jgi:hypothetical protein
VHRASDGGHLLAVLGVYGDHVVGEVAREDCLPAVLQAAREQRVEQGVHGRVGDRADVFGHDRADVAEALVCPIT